jgi:hypothetical protein
MTSLLRAALDAVVASFGPELPAAKQPPEGFGVDLDCADDLDPMMGLVDGLRVVAQASTAGFRRRAGWSSTRPTTGSISAPCSTRA